MKITLLFILVTSSLAAQADSCFPLYQKKAEEIQKKDGYTQYVGSQFYVANGQLAYWQGIPVQARIDNWARDLVDAIKWGPYLWSHSDDPRREWLETFRKSIKSECLLPEDNYESLRAMLKELMEDGSFCRDGQVLEPKLFGGKKAFKKILQDEVNSQRFAHYCQGAAVFNSTLRDAKEISDKTPATKNSGTSEQ